MSAVFPIAVPPRAMRAGEPLDVEARLVAQARAPAPLRRALARVAGCIADARGWERLGYARLADYAVERAGISPRELRDLAAVDRALRELPGLDAAFLAGTIGWTQLRLLCRVSRPEDERQWLAAASRLTARALAREVRAVDRRAREPLCASSERDEGRVGVVLRLTPRARARWWKARQVANRVAGSRALALRVCRSARGGGALGGSGRRRVRAGARCGGGARSRARAERSAVARGAASHPSCADVDALERDLDAADAFELDRRLRRAVQLEARGLARVAALLADVVAWGLHRERGFRGLDAYAEERLGMAPSRARALLRIARAGRVYAPLRVAFADGHLSWVQAHALVPLVLEPAAARHRAQWIAHAQRVSVRRLGDDVERALATGGLAPPPLESGADACCEALQTGAATLFFSASLEVAQLFAAVLASVQRRLERIRGRPCTRSDALEAMLDHALATWQPEKQSREHAVFERDGWRCTVPGCTSYRNLQSHHVVFRSAGGSDDPSNLTTLCAWHHLRGVHGHVLRCTGAAPGRLRFEFGLRADRPPLAVYRSGEVRMS